MNDLYGELSGNHITHADRTMDSNEIAILTDKRHADVIRDIENMLVAAGIDQRRFASIYSDSYGRNQRCYRLPGHELMLLLTGYSVPLRDAVLRRWEDLERASTPEFKVPATLVEALLLAAEIESKRMDLEHKVARLAPAAAAAERISSAAGLRTLTQIGKINGIGPRKIFELLEERGLIYRLRGAWVPVQTWIDAGYFILHESTYSTPDGEEHLSSQTYVTGKGEIWLAKRLFATDDMLLDFSPGAMA
ncbi:MAG: hypothetical protein A2001_01545 [Treponema sp. GWC1_61_84]|nr:MAG: hypothetical protein A2001_01545 [Treponema sp. GWC1_61_84]